MQLVRPCIGDELWFLLVFELFNLDKNSAGDDDYKLEEEGDLYVPGLLYIDGIQKK